MEADPGLGIEDVTAFGVAIPDGLEDLTGDPCLPPPYARLRLGEFFLWVGGEVLGDALGDALGEARLFSLLSE